MWGKAEFTPITNGQREYGHIWSSSRGFKIVC